MGIKKNVLCFVGASGVGKGTIVKLLLNDFGRGFGFSVSHTTRRRRRGEVDGVDYHFVNSEEMKQDIRNGKFAEHAQVHGNLYGTSFDAMRAVHDSGKICLLDIDLNGLRALKGMERELEFGIKCVGIVPPTYKVLEQRLRYRKSESELGIQQRLVRAVEDTEFCEKSELVDHLLTNFNSYEYGYPQVLSLLKRWYPASFGFC